MEGKGYSLLRIGRGFGTEGDGAYFEFEDALGYIVEAIETPQATSDPERTFPE